MLLAVLFWAINFSFVKIALRELSPLAFNGIRMFFASIIIVIILFISREGLFMSRADFWKIVFLGIIGNTIYQMFFIHGLNLTTASNASIIMAMTPIFIALLSFFLKHEKIHWAAWFGIMFSFVGFYFVITKEFGHFDFSWYRLRGDLLIFLGNIFWAIYTVLSKPLLERISPLKLASLTMAIGTVFYLPFCVKDIISINFSKVSFNAWASLLYSGLFALAICYVIWYSSVKRVGNSKTAIYGNIMPILTIIFAYIFISERITLLQAGGALVILIGVYLTRSGYRLFDKRKIA